MESFWPPASLDFGVEEYGSVRYEYMADYSYRRAAPQVLMKKNTGQLACTQP